MLAGTANKRFFYVYTHTKSFFLLIDITTLLMPGSRFKGH